MLQRYNFNRMVRVLHLPTGIAAESWCRRSQHQNRLAAMELLKARMWAAENLEQSKELFCYEFPEGVYFPDDITEYRRQP